MGLESPRQALLYLALSLLLFFGCAQTCTDGIQNQNETGTDCGGPCPPCWNPCGLSVLDPTYNQYDYMTNPICLLLVNPNGTAHKMLFYPTVDYFTLLDMAATFGYANTSLFTANYSTTHPTDVPNLLYVQIGNLTSSPMHQSWSATDGTTLVAPYFQIVINLKAGALSSLSWDTTCAPCSSNLCSPNGICGVKTSDCDVFSGGSTNCDLKVYVAWSGYDASGRFLFSQDEVLSNFVQYSVTSAAQNLASTTAQTFPQFSRPNGQP